MLRDAAGTPQLSSQPTGARGCAVTCPATGFPCASCLPAAPGRPVCHPDTASRGLRQKCYFVLIQPTEDSTPAWHLRVTRWAGASCVQGTAGTGRKESRSWPQAASDDITRSSMKPRTCSFPARGWPGRAGVWLHRNGFSPTVWSGRVRHATAVRRSISAVRRSMSPGGWRSWTRSGRRARTRGMSDVN